MNVGQEQPENYVCQNIGTIWRCRCCFTNLERWKWLSVCVMVATLPVLWEVRKTSRHFKASILFWDCRASMDHAWNETNRSGLVLSARPLSITVTQNIFFVFELSLSLSLVSVFKYIWYVIFSKDFTEVEPLDRYHSVIKDFKHCVIHNFYISSQIQRQMTRYIAKRYRFNWLQW